MTRLLHLMNYSPLGTRAFDHFILEYDRQARSRGWDTTFGFIADPPASMAQLQWFRYDLPWTAGNDRLIADCAPDVVQTSFHSAFEKPIHTLKEKGLTKRLLIIDHSSGEGPLPHGIKAGLRRYRGWRVGRQLDAIVCVSEYIAKRDIERVFLPRGKVRVVPNGIDLARFPLQTERQFPPTVLYVGQLMEEKGVATLIEAARRLSRPAEVLIAGQGPLRDSLVAAAKNLAGVQFLGHVSDVGALYRQANVVVIPSLWAEAFGLIVIEAMASGAVVLASDAGALPEVVGDAGIIFAKGNADDLAGKLQALLDNPAKCRQLALVGRRRVEEHFQLHDCVRRHLDIIEEIQNQI